MARTHTAWGIWEPESLADHWVSRRDSRLRRPIASLGQVSADGVPYLAPDVQLFYKAKGLRAKDEADFTAALPVLMPEQRRWLSAALGDHPWQRRLGDAD